MSALPVTKRYAKSHGQDYLNSDGFVGLINGSLHRFRPTLSEGIPDGPIDFALNAAGVTGLPATIARSVANHVARRGTAPGITLLRRPPSARHALPCLRDTRGVLARFLFARWLCKPRGAVSKSCIGVPIVTTAVALLRNPDIPPAAAPRPIPCAAGLLPMNSASQSPLAPQFPPRLPPRPRAGHTSARASRTSPCMTSCVTSLCWTTSTQNTASRSAWVARWVYSWAWFLLGARTS